MSNADAQQVFHCMLQVFDGTGFRQAAVAVEGLYLWR
jgi:hypothetical protein